MVCKKRATKSKSLKRKVKGGWSLGGFLTGRKSTSVVPYRPKGSTSSSRKDDGVIEGEYRVLGRPKKSEAAKAAQRQRIAKWKAEKAEQKRQADILAARRKSELMIAKGQEAQAHAFLRRSRRASHAENPLFRPLGEYIRPAGSKKSGTKKKTKKSTSKVSKALGRGSGWGW